MIRNESEYRVAVQRLKAAEVRMNTQLQSLAAMDLSPQVVERMMESLRAPYSELIDEIECYAQSKNCQRAEVDDLNALGRALIGMRIAQGITQRELAQRVNVSEQTISRSELNEHRGISLERAARLFEALDVRVKLTVERKPDAARSVESAA